MTSRKKKGENSEPKDAGPKSIENEETPQSTETPAPQKAIPVVGIGASAGGLKALEGFFAHLPPRTGMAFVVVQHLDPHRESYLPSLLQAKTSMPICVAGDGMRVEPDHVYLKPPDRGLVIRHGALFLQTPGETGLTRLSIDEFFRSLARDQGENAVAIVLSGAGSDGAEGVREVHAAGGLVLAQTEEEADYDSMPRSAVETGVTDLVLPVEKMGRELVGYFAHTEAARREMKRQSADARFGDDIRKILGAVHTATGHDFSQYKKSTIRRRIERRMAIHQTEKLSEYAPYIRQNPAEAQALFKDLLINVTSFFRDPEAFDLLQEEMAVALEPRDPEDPIRVWIPGCATGEEAYTIAILLLEIMDRLERDFPVCIFATDINPQSIEAAREGLYPENVAGDLTEKRLRRFFSRQGNHYKVGNQLREMVVFAVHDIARDPLFPASTS